MLKSNLKQLGSTQAELAAPQRREGECSEPYRSGGGADSGAAVAGPHPRPGGPGQAQAPTVPSWAKPRTAGMRAPPGPCCVVRGCTSHLTTWRRQRELGEQEALSPEEAGPQVHDQPAAEENQRLRAENVRLSRRLRARGKNSPPETPAPSNGKGCSMIPAVIERSRWYRR